MVAHGADGNVLTVGSAHRNVLIGGPEDQDLYACISYGIAVGAPYGLVDTIKKSIDVAKSCLKLGQFAFAPIAPILGALAEVGTLVQSILAFVPTDKPDPFAEIRKELKVLGQEIEQLSKAMTAKFNDLKEFLIELNFYREVVVPTANMTSYMMDCLKNPSEQAKENFRSAYSKHSPLSLAKTVLSLMDYDTTNPLKIAMNNDPMKTKNTFNKWYNIIDGCLGQLLFLEAFASGLLHNKSAYNPEALRSASQELFEKIGELKEQYKKSSEYWPAVKEFTEKYLESNRSKSTKEKADGIKKTLETILTYDSFYIVITEHWGVGGDWKFRYHVHNKDQLIELYGPGNGNALIYRSRKANLVDQEKLTRMRRDVKRTYVHDGSAWNSLDAHALFKTFETAEWMAPGWYEPGFCGVFTGLNETLQSANCDKNDGEPGWWSHLKKFPSFNNSDRFLIVGHI